MFKLDEIRGLADVPRVQARSRGAAIAQIFEDRETTFSLFDERISRVAQGLIAAGLPAQSRIGFLGKNSDRYFELLFGAAKAETVLVGINWRLALPEIEYILNDAGCTTVFVGAEYYEVVEQLAARNPSLSLIVALDGGHPSWPAFDAWRDAQAAVDPLLPMRADDDVLQLYTSGTTGHPKGVRLTNANYLALWEASEAARWGLFDAEQVTLTCMPVFHVAGCNMGVFALAQGSTNLILKDVDPYKILEFVPRYHVAYALFVPALMLMLTQLPQSASTDFSSLRKLFYGASPINEDLLKTAQQLFACEFFGLYGLTETTGGGTCLLPEGHAAGKLRSCGTAYPGVEVKVIDGEGRAVANGAVGEIVIRHGIVMKGYWNRPEATAEAIRDGWFYTGDAGYLDDEGYLYIHDRVKDMVVSGGENVYPAEVENALFGHAAIADVAVIGVPDDRWGEAVKAVVVLKPGATVTADELIAYARERIAGFKAPKSVDFVSALPRNPSGKILRRELREPYWRGRSRNVN
ncbi:MAG: long-chain-fatty-acid--CoA ligase [Gammaproteobacteria bacterium]|nr:long-chain-fatty-acid--CoA ligase [Gammaproteobacteria bacterium]